MLKKIVVFVLIALVIPVLTVSAATYDAAFPSSNTYYSSFTNGTGCIPAGGQSTWMWTTDDYVTQTFTATGLNSVNSLAYNFTYDNNLSQNLTVNLLINGIQIDQFMAPNTSGGDTIVNDLVFFSPIFGNGTYALSMVLGNTIDPGYGSIAFKDGGTWTLGSSAVPEPATMLLLGLGILGLAGIRRK